MAPPVTERQVKAIILRELPAIVERDPQVRDLILRLSQEQFADKRETSSRFDRVLEELRRDREEQARKWDEQHAEDARKWDEQARLWEEQRAEDARKWDEQHAEDARKWDEQHAEDARKWDEQARRWEEQNRKWDEQNQKWWENQKAINEMLASIRDLARKHDSTLGALGARWGLNTEQSFRNALKGILESSFGVQVLNVAEFDDTGEVFGRPEQIELDVLIRNGVLILGEIKSSMSRSDLYAFDRKTRFYEKRHQRTASRRLVISPMVEARAQEVARQLGIEVYSYAEDVPAEPVGSETVDSEQ